MDAFLYLLIPVVIYYLYREFVVRERTQEENRKKIEWRKEQDEIEAVAKKRFEDDTRGLVSLAGKEGAMEFLEKQVADIDFQIRDLEANEAEFGFDDMEEEQRHKEKMDAYRAKRDPLVNAWNFIKYRM